MKYNKLIVILFITILICNVAMYAQTEPLDTDGDGYRNISTLEELRWVSENDSSWTWDFELDNNINAADTKNWNNSEGWSPIGNNTKFFQGIFDGKDYEIDSIYINRSSQIYVGLFGYIGGAEIRNVGVVNCDITGYGSVGGLVGGNFSSIVFNSYSTGTVSGIGYVGGLVGYNYVSRMRNSYSRGSIEGDVYVGGLVGGNNQSSSVINSYSTGSVSGSKQVGGLVGYNHFSEVLYSFWDTQTSGIDSSAGGPGCTGKSTAEMKTKSTFTDVGWDFENIWKIDGDTNDGYPYFRDVPSSIVENETKVEKNILVYPNPASEYLRISIPDNHPDYKIGTVESDEIEIYDVLGNKVAHSSTPSLLRNATPQEGNFKIDISHLPRGVYFVKIGDRVEKFIKL